MQKKITEAPIGQIQVAGFAEQSVVNGPGRRVVIWVQGCSLGCPGCFNPGTHGAGGETLGRGALVDRILAARTEQTTGVTFSGGEPFQQAKATADVAARVRTAWPEASIMAFSGYRLEELRDGGAPPAHRRCWPSSPCWSTVATIPSAPAASRGADHATSACGCSVDPSAARGPVRCSANCTSTTTDRCC